MKFVKYPKIINHYSEREKEYVNHLGYNLEKWYITEKIHGANFSFWIDDINVKIANRSGFTYNFYNCSEIIKERYLDKMRNLFNYIKMDFPLIKYIGVYGELFGGSYPHVDIPQDSEAKQIQKEVKYSPHNDFISFDILMIFNDNEFKFMDMNEFNRYMIMCNVPHIYPLYIGTFEECMNYDINFNSKIPEQFNLPPLENNLCEGVVIKPLYSLTFNNGKRVIFKKKNIKFSENKYKKSKPTLVLSHNISIVVDEMKDYINDNRFNSVISKIKIEGMEDTPKLIKLFYEDVYEDYVQYYMNHHTTKFEDDFKKDELKIISKVIGKELGKFVPPKLRKWLIN